MVFSSLTFFYLFLPITLVVYVGIPKRFRNAWLLIASLFFYGWGEPVFLLLMLFSILVNYVHGYWIARQRSAGKSGKWLLVSDIVINLALLGYFKYAGLLTDTLRLLPAFGALPEVNVPLPIGISFYTFQTMSYVIDVYRGDAPVQKRIVPFAAYVSLFPQLIAGPIVRYVDVDEQLTERPFTLTNVASGIRLFLCGLAKKVLLANRVGEMNAKLLALDGSAGALGAWLGIIAFAMQIYFDFSGYSDMARGLGRIFGFEFVVNFRYPYIAQSVTDFWRRWHISLSTWFREYVYIPLGGNRRGKGRTLLNLMIVWLLTGLWHGASVNYILWGVYFGVLLILEKTVLLNVLKKLPAALRHLYAVLCFLFGWVIFSFEDMGEMGIFLGRLFGSDGALPNAAGVEICLRYLPILLLSAFACLPVGHQLYERFCRTQRSGALLSGVCIAGIVLLTALLVSQSYNPFLYFRF